MCDSHKQHSLSTTGTLFIAALLGLLCAWLDYPLLNQTSDVVSDIFIRLLKLVSLPIIFFSLLSTLSGMGGDGRCSYAGRSGTKIYPANNNNRSCPGTFALHHH